jgi:MFS family permease
MGSVGMFGALREREFRLLWLGQTTSVLGDALVPVALAFAVIRDLHGSRTDLGLVLGAQTLALVVFVLAGGVWADRLPRQLVMLTSDVVRGSVQATVAALLLTGSAKLWQLVVLAAVFGTADAFFQPASTGLVPLTISPARLQQANALLGLSRSTAFLVGPAVAGVIVAVSRPGIALAIDAATFGVSIVSLSLLRPRRGPVAEPQTFLADLLAGWRDFSSRPWLWGIVLWSTTVLFVVVAPFQVLGPFVANARLGGAGAWGAILACGSAGSLVGGMAALRLKPERPLFISCALFGLYAIPIALLAIPAPTAAIAAGSFVGGTSIGYFMALWQTTMQQHVPADKLSRVSAYDWMGSLAFFPLGLLAAGPLAGLIGTPATLWLAATWMVISTGAVLLIPDVRNLRRQNEHATSHNEMLPAGHPAPTPP